MVFRTLSGRFILLTLVFVILAEIMILVPSLARFRVEFLQDRLERSQMASLALLTTPSVMIDETLEAELLANAGVLNVALKRDHTRELFLSTPDLGPIEGMYDMRESSWPQLIWDAMKVLWTDEARNIRVVGEPVRNAGEMIDVVMDESTLRVAMLEYGRNILLLSAVISIATSILLFLAVQYLMVRPINRLTRGMLRYAAQPEDASRVIQPRDGGTELHDAERALQSMQTQLTESLAHKERLANLGQAVSDINHDLRGILSIATLLVDPLRDSSDPDVTRNAPRLIRSLSRAERFCETMLQYAKGKEPPLQLHDVDLMDLLADVVEGERLAASAGSGTASITISLDGPESAIACVDKERIHRVAANLIRNAREAVATTGRDGRVGVSLAENSAAWSLTIEDDGPGIPPSIRDRLFVPFSSRGKAKNGTGLGLAISLEIIRSHGGQLELLNTGDSGSVFRALLPKTGAPRDGEQA